MPSLRFSVRFLLFVVAILATGLAIPAYYVGQIRAETNAGRLLELATTADANDRGGASQFGVMVSWCKPIGRFRRTLYNIAGSAGELHSIDIVGDRSGKTVLDNASVLQNVQMVRILTREGPFESQRSSLPITQLQVDAAAVLLSTDWLQIHGRLASGIQLSPLSRLSRLTRLEIEAPLFSNDAIRQVAELRAEQLAIYCDYYNDGDSPLPAEAFASFIGSPCRWLSIWGGIDDRVLELVALAPRLESLQLHCFPGSLPGPDQKPSITDEGLRRASKHLHVWSLEIDGDCQLTDDCIEAVAGIQELRRVDLAGVTDSGKKRLRELRPDID